ncbi:putative ribonuclease H-like domain-containing protein [Tanacetum coccineum]|uniref:Ribonuclease H-like domain-containing protein n=1 Tax=Tanacetum coccineum TaxID=301880 RepID=A0ABQ5BUS5_9ASTR
MSGCSRSLCLETYGPIFVQISKTFDGDELCSFVGGAKERGMNYGKVTDDYSRFSWVFFLRTKDETSEILKNFIKEVENLVDKKVKIIRSDNGTEFKNHVMDEFCREKGIKREYSVARTPQQNGVAERKNRTLIEAARTMLADSKLPTTFWAEAVSTACYVQNRVLIVKPHNKTPYELFRGIKPAIGFMKPFGCHVTILNTLDKLGKFDGKSDEGFFVGYSLSSKAFRVYNIRTRKVQENLHVGFLENKPMIEGNGPKWLFDLDSLTQSMNYVPVVAGTFSNDSAGIQGVSESSTSSQQDQDWIAMPIWKDASYFGDASPNIVDDATEESHDGSNIQNNGTADQQVNTARQEVNTVLPVYQLILYYVSNKKDDNLRYSELGHFLKSTCKRNSFRVKLQNSYGFLVDLLLRDIGLLYKVGSTENKKDERGIVVRKQASLGCPSAYTRRWKLDVTKVLSMYGQIEVEVYVCQPSVLKISDHPDMFYKSCWNSTIWTSSKHPELKELCEEFEKLMKDKFQMSSMGDNSPSFLGSARSIIGSLNVSYSI